MPLAPRLMGADHRTIGVYGMSETATCVTAARFDDPEAVRTGSFGRPLAGMEVRIADPDTRRRAAAWRERRDPRQRLDADGRLLPRAACGDVHAEGFFRTGDRGYLDARRQSALRRPHQGRDQDRRRERRRGRGRGGAGAPPGGARPRTSSASPTRCAAKTSPRFVVLRPHRQTAAEELRVFCRESLASYKVPRHLFVVGEAEVPRTATGKVEKAALRRAAEALIACERAPGCFCCGRLTHSFRSGRGRLGRGATPASTSHSSHRSFLCPTAWLVDSRQRR